MLFLERHAFRCYPVSEAVEYVIRGSVTLGMHLKPARSVRRSSAAMTCGASTRVGLGVGTGDCNGESRVRCVLRAACVAVSFYCATGAVAYRVSIRAGHTGGSTGECPSSVVDHRKLEVNLCTDSASMVDREHRLALFDAYSVMCHVARTPADRKVTEGAQGERRGTPQGDSSNPPQASSTGGGGGGE